MLRLSLSSPFHRGTLALILLSGTTFSVLFWQYFARQDAERIHAGFRSRAETQAAVVNERLRTYQEMVYSLRDSFLGQNTVTRQEFAQVAQSLLQRHAGVRALEWVRILPGPSRAALEQQAAAELGRPFVIKRLQPDGSMRPAPDAPEYFVITYIEPLAGNEAVMGYDVSSAPSAPLLAAARLDGKFKVSPPFRLGQTGGENAGAGVIFIMPFNRHGMPGAPVDGFVQGVFLLQTMLAQSHQLDTNEALDSYYLDGADGHAAPTLLYANFAGHEPMRSPGATVALPPMDDPADFHATLQLGEHHWHLLIRENAAWAGRMTSPQPVFMLAGGLAITVLLVLFIHSLLQRTGRIEHEVRERTRQLRASEARLQDILDHSPANIFIKDLEGRYLVVNQHLVSHSRRPYREIIGRRDDELYPAEQAALYRANDARVLAASRPMEFEEFSTTPAGPRTSIVQKFPLLDDQGRVYAICGIATDITERKQAEAELQENRRQLSNLISQLPGAAFRCNYDEHMTALFASEGMLALTGYPASDFTSGRLHISSLTVPDDRPAAQAALAASIREGRAYEIEYRFQPREGPEKWVLVRGRPVYDEAGKLRFLESLAIDVTALKQAEQEKLAFERNLLETQKLESLGVMAGGIAHDFNNILTAVLGNASLLRLALPPADAGQTNLEQIETAARRATDLCTQMLAYAGKGKIAVGPLDLSRLVRDTTAMLEVSIRSKNCALTLQLADALPAVLGDTAQLNQIVMNLVINASEAIGERADGKIAVRTFARPADPALFRGALHRPNLPGGLYAGLEVRDNGCGMTPETLGRIFEPFFTTKFSGRGLGLSAVLGIVQGHRGALFVESQPGAGSTFRLLLPTVEAAPAATPAEAVAADRPPLRGTVLVVDDEEGVRQVIGAMLRRHAAQVLFAANGEQALALYATQWNRIDLILLDLTMPGLSGEETLRRLQPTNPRTKIVIMSGYSEEESMRRCAVLGVAGFLRKPFELRELVDKLRAHLN